MPIPADEEIVRAICSDKYDGQEISPSLWVGQNISVSRLKLISLADHWEMFRRHVEKPPERHLELIGQIKVDLLQDLGRSSSIELTVEPKSEDWNPAHAEIPQKITRGLANKILKNLSLHSVPPIDS